MPVFLCVILSQKLIQQGEQYGRIDRTRVAERAVGSCVEQVIQLAVLGIVVIVAVDEVQQAAQSIIVLRLCAEEDGIRTCCLCAEETG